MLMNLLCCDRVLKNNLGDYKLGLKTPICRTFASREKFEKLGQQSQTPYIVTVAMAYVYEPTNRNTNLAQYIGQCDISVVSSVVMM